MVWFARQLLAAILSFLLTVPVFSNGNDQPRTDTYDYDAFGNLIHQTGTTPNNYLFAGEQFDPDLGLYYNRARYLNVTTGRFWIMDTLEGTEFDPASLHKYLYVDNDPVNMGDSSGHQPPGGVAEAEGTAAIGADLDASVNNYINLFEILNSARFSASVLAVSTLLAAAIVAADILFDNKDRKDDGMKRRGRIGIQGNDVRKQARALNDIVGSLQWKLDFGTGGSTVSVSRDTLAWGWSRTWPVLKVEGTAALALLKVQLGSNGLACRQSALEKANAAILSGPLPQGFMKDYQGENYSYCDGSERVDIQVFQGTAFDK